MKQNTDRVLNPCLAKAGYREGGNTGVPHIDITKDCYEVRFDFYNDNDGFDTKSMGLTL